MIFPLATLDDLHLELEDTNRSLLRLGEGLVVNEGRREERRQMLLKWRRRIEAQIALMEAAA
jgi:hypothetical protein